MTLNDLHINKTWTLFLDRDGVINKKLDNDYVKHWVEFEFIEGVLQNFKTLNEIFGRIVVVTNQQGIGKGIYRVEDLELIHKNMQYELDYFKGKIDKVYFSPHLEKEIILHENLELAWHCKRKKTFRKLISRKVLL